MLSLPGGPSPSVYSSLGPPSLAQLEVPKWQSGVGACVSCSQEAPTPCHLASWSPRASTLGAFCSDGCWYPYATHPVSPPVQTLCPTDYMPPNLPLQRLPDLIKPCIQAQGIPPPPPFPDLPLLQPPSLAEVKPCLTLQQRNVQGSNDMYRKIERLYRPYHPEGCRPVLLLLSGSTREPGLEQVWNQHFELLFRTLPNVWYFGPIEKTPTGWSVFKDMAKVRFSCQRCSHGWTSMYGLVVFYYRWDGFLNQGHVRFILTGQKCNQCERTTFETPMWYPEEAQKVMTNLYHEVANRVYGLQTPPLIRDRRHGRPRQQHNSSMCEGCHQGICKTPRGSAPSTPT
ncbi:uncharacterized protein LOC122246529 isoform X1 [Penaeus japonicus]|uniref:uncharacterized protein LOC122246529 isoform X1 n=1 Tax=Penaeus japonicus TaxID=27405 RepID=UPI001C715790|nr:uncharacterized protein LOC122246529 isoform X1 [Penaeus japonicus]